MGKTRLGIFSFTGCAGEQLVILECGAKLFELYEVAEIKAFNIAQDASLNTPGKSLDIALLEGSITTEVQKDELIKIRANTKIVVAMGTCACFGGVQASKSGEGNWEERFKKVYGTSSKLFRAMQPFESAPCNAFVKIDHYIPGCPVDKKQLISSLARLLNNATPQLYKFPVCTECKWQENECLLLRNELCLGPITRGGCSAVCPSLNLPCVGCWGGADSPNISSEYKLLTEKKFSNAEIQHKFSKFGSMAMIEELSKIKNHCRASSATPE
jgi:sulfhydrogenase subunit delta